MQFYEKLKKLRSDMGITQAELAEKIYVSRSAVAKWESGLGLPNNESLATIAEFFGVEKSELLSDPETASVIVKKNHTLSKQKLWITVLVALSCILIIVAAILIPFAVKNSNTTKRELIFDTERKIDTSQIVNYPETYLKVENEFAPTRVFTIPTGMNVVKLPELLIKVTRKGKVSYEVLTEDPTFTYSDQVYIYRHTDGEFYGTLRDTSLEDCAGCINIEAGGLYLSVKIVKASVPVESIQIGSGGQRDTIGIFTSKYLSVDIKPVTATYKNYSYIIEKIVHPNGIIYSPPLEKYAYMYNDILYTTDQIDVGATIYLYAETEVGNVKSNTLEITVERLNVYDISLENEENPSVNAITSGGWKHVRLKFYPESATVNVKHEGFDLTVSNPDIASVEKTADGFILSVTNDISAINKQFSVKVTAADGFSREFDWYIISLPVESIIQAKTRHVLTFWQGNGLTI